MDELIKAINNPNMINDIVNIMCENRKLQKENSLLKEELKELKDGIEGVYNNMNALEIINKKELDEEIEEI